MSQDYTKRFGNQIRDRTIPGIIANIIRAQQQAVPLFQTTAIGGLAGGGAASGGACGLTFNPAILSLVVPANDTGSIGQSVTVTSTVAQTVTFSVVGVGTLAACLGTPTVTPSTFIFTAGLSATIVISMPYANCTDTTTTATLALSATTNSGCSTGTAVTGNVSVSNAPTFVLEITCDGSQGFCTSAVGVYGTAASDSNSSNPSQGSCSGASIGGLSEGSPRVRSVNGFAGTITITYTGLIPTSLTTPCGRLNSGCSLSVTLIVGQTLNLCTSPFVAPCSFQAGPLANPAAFACEGTCTVSGTSGSITKTAIYVSLIYARTC